MARRGRNEGTIYERRDGLSVGQVTGQAKRHNAGSYFSLKAEHARCYPLAYMA